MVIGSWVWGLVVLEYGIDVVLVCVVVLLIFGVVIGYWLCVLEFGMLDLDLVNCF